MKKIYTLLVGSLMSLAALAGRGYNDGKLSVTYAGTDNITISVDGYNYNERDNAVLVENLQPGYHTIKVTRERKRNGWGNGRRREEVLYSTSIYVKARTFVDIMINRFGKALVDEQRMDNNGRWDDDYPRDRDRDRDRDYDDRDWNNGYGNVMNEREFNTVKDQLRKEWFENNRLTSAKTIMDGSNFTTRQVKELMLLFTFENNRLEVAKYAYRKTVDKENYYQLNDALTFSSSKDELARFIRESR